jgi:hypothetical protein
MKLGNQFNKVFIRELKIRYCSCQMRHAASA